MADTSLFTRLKRLFSNDVIVRNVGGKKLKVVDTDRIEFATDRNSLRDRFNRLRSSTYNLHNRDQALSYQSARLELFRDYDTMDMDPILASALDIYCDEMLTKSEMGNILTIKSDDDNIKKILENLFYDILNVEFNLWSWARNMCKYGDFFLRMEISPEYGVFGVMPLSAYEITRVEGSDPTNKNYVKFQHDGSMGGAEYENFEIAHFRLLSDSNFLPYGKCLRGESEVWTPQGVKMIKNLREGDDVYSFDYKTGLVKTQVSKQVMSGIKRIYEVKTAHRKIYATSEHPIMLADGSYKSLSKLSLDDYLILPTVKQSNTEYPKLLVEESNEWKFDNKLVKISERLLKDNFDELVRFFGFMLGDGWLDKSNKTVCFSIGDRIDKSDRYVEFIKKLGLSYRITNEGTTKANCVINSVYLYKLMELLDFRTGSFNKIVPEWIGRVCSDTRKQLLFGFADADGCDIDDNTFQLGAVNEKLIDELRIIAMQCGLSVTKKWITESHKNRKNPCIMHVFTYRLKSRDFIDVNGTHHIEKIRSIKEIGKEEVYDIQVKSNLSNFIADGIVVHNSILEGARRVWKQLSLMEDAMLIHRIMRAPEKRIFKIDIGNIPPSDVDAYMEKIINKMKKTPYLDERTGDYNLRFNLQNMVEDFFMPVRGGDSGTSIDTLSGMEFTGTDDIEYLRNKMMAALKIPKAFLGYDENLSGKSTLAAEDVRFARTIVRVQRVLISELTKIAIVHLYSQGFTDASLVDFSIELTNPSTILEQEKIAIWNDKIAVAKDMIDNKIFPRKWVYQNVFDLSKGDMETVSKDMIDDLKESYRYKQIEEQGNDPATSKQNVGEDGELTDAGGSGEPGGSPEESPPPPGGGGDEAIPPPPLKEDAKEEEKDDIESKLSVPSAKDISNNHKKDRKYPYGEDPLGNISNRANPRKISNPIVHKYAGNSPLALEIDLKKLKSHLLKTDSKNKQILKESPSLLDEKNIIDDNPIK